MNSEQDNIMMNTMYWWGVPTLFRCKNDNNIQNCDIALVGVPHSTGNGTTERDQHLGPRAVRNVSAGLRRVHLDFGFNPWKEKIIHDLGTTKNTLMLINLLNQINKTSLAIYAGRKAVYKNIYLPSLNFPLPDNKLLKIYKETIYC